MKNIRVLTILIATFTFTVPVFANSNNQGFSGPNQGINTVKQVLDAGFFSDDMPVTLTGYITSSLGGEMYLFTDGTGEVTIEIEHDKWLGQSVTPKNKVQLSGEIDKEIGGVKVDVDVIRILE